MHDYTSFFKFYFISLKWEYCTKLSFFGFILCSTISLTGNWNPNRCLLKASLDNSKEFSDSTPNVFLSLVLILLRSATILSTQAVPCGKQSRADANFPSSGNLGTCFFALPIFLTYNTWVQNFSGSSKTSYGYWKSYAASVSISLIKFPSSSGGRLSIFGHRALK